MTSPSDPAPMTAQRRGAAGWGGFAALAVALSVTAGPVRAAPPAATVGSTAPRGAAATAPSRAPDAPRSTASGQDGDAGSHSVAARARMNECGHQWNNMKRSGAASGTWKEFSRSCLAQR